MNSPKECPWCGMISSGHAWTCGSFSGWDGGEPHQSLACAEIERLKKRVEKLEAVANECKKFFREKFHNAYDVNSALDAMEAPDA